MQVWAVVSDGTRHVKALADGGKHVVVVGAVTVVVATMNFHLLSL